MRAADALFSIPSSAKSDRDDRPEGVRPSSFDGASHADPSHQEKNGGRILRVLDEDPIPEYAALEAEHAPKRRGRKPGSKNKPKAVVTARSAPIGLDSYEEAAPAWPMPIQAVVASRPPTPAARKIPAIAATPAVANAAPAASPALAKVGPSRGDKRFNWVRDRLKPGEDWKRRRLPRICW